MSEFSELVKGSVDIVSVVKEYVPRLRKAGTRWVAPCPFHNERTPSFGVNEVLRIYKCFGCGKGGDVISFVMEMESLSWWEAVKTLAERNGIPLPRRSPQADEDAKRRSGLYELHEVALESYREQLASPGGEPARAYLAKRGVKPAIAEQFGLGVSSRAGQTLFRRFQQAGFPPDLIEKSGLAVRRQDGSGFFDRFRGRLMFPIHGETGKIAGFAGRALSDEDQPKYLNSPETELYQKKLLLYNLHRARKQIARLDRAILVEGYMDVIGLWSAGVEEVVASCGTALGPDQVRILQRFSPNIVINFDPDPAGMNAAERTLQMLIEEGMHVRVLELEGGLDPDEFVLHRGSDAYRAAVGAAPRYFHWLADRARFRFDMRAAEGRVAAFRYLLPAIQKLSGKIERAATAEDLASYLGVAKSVVLDELKQSAVVRSPTRPPAPRSSVPPTERLLLRCLIASDQARIGVLARLNSIAFLEPLTLGPVFKALAAAGEPFDYSALESRLTDRERTLLTDVVFADNATIESESDPGGDALAQALSCLHALETRNVDLRIRDLKARVTAAEKAGDVREALELSRELDDLERSRRRSRA
jgi:DNA primase